MLLPIISFKIIFPSYVIFFKITFQHERRKWKSRNTLHCDRCLRCLWNREWRPNWQLLYTLQKAGSTLLWYDSSLPSQRKYKVNFMTSWLHQYISGMSKLFVRARWGQFVFQLHVLPSNARATGITLLVRMEGQKFKGSSWIVVMTEQSYENRVNEYTKWNYFKISLRLSIFFILRWCDCWSAVQSARPFRSWHFQLKSY